MPDSTQPTPVEDLVLDVGGIPISGLLAWPAGPPRLFLLALHGGGLRATYFHAPTHPDASLLSVARAVGVAALAIDRPGYGASAGVLPDGLHLEEQGGLIWSVVAAVRSRFGVGAPLFLLGHSFGMKVALQMAACPAEGDLVGVDCSGAGMRYSDELPDHPGKAAREPRGLTTAERVALFWGVSSLYPPGTMDRTNRPTAPVPPAEAIDSAIWPERLLEIGPQVRVPVRYTVADHERWWDVNPETLAAFQVLFSSSPRVEIGHQRAAGHNISLGWTARAYHLRALAFAEECLIDRASPEEVASR